MFVRCETTGGYPPALLPAQGISNAAFGWPGMVRFLITPFCNILWLPEQSCQKLGAGTCLQVPSVWVMKFMEFASFASWLRNSILGVFFLGCEEAEKVGGLWCLCLPLSPGHEDILYQWKLRRSLRKRQDLLGPIDLCSCHLALSRVV